MKFAALFDKTSTPPPHRPEYSARCSSLIMTRFWSTVGFLWLLLLLVAPTPTSAQEFNFQVELRILERLEFYMGDPVAASTLIENFRTNGVFPHNLQAPDRDLYLKVAFGLSQPLVYYALEDGTIPGFYWANGYYREPGNAGYAVTDEAMNKHLTSCVNGFTGEPTNCTLDQGKDYIACKDGLGDDTGLCEIVEICPNQPQCTLLASQQQQQECFSSLKYCRQYTIETNFDATNSRGFIPLTNFCINPQGQFSEQIAGVIDPRGTERTSEQLTTCKHGNGAIVNRRTYIGNNNNNDTTTTTMPHNYAYCGYNQEGICGDTFVAGYESFEYDPRYRPWYIDTKAAQKPLWHPPYPFFTLGIGVTYTRPIYDTDPETGRQIFAGVLSVDYRFDDITNFLIQSYGNTTTAVIIYENSEPNYVIATSTGSDTVTFVLDSDPTLPCPVNRGDDVPCSPVRIPILDFVGETPLDMILQTAAQEHYQRNYPKYLLSIKGSDNSFYVSQSTLYEQVQAQLSWRVIIAAPGAVSNADRIVRGDELFVALIVIATVGVLACVSFLCLLVVYRSEKAVIFADWRFTCAFIFGCVLLNGSTFALLGENTNILCLLRMWSFHLCFAVALAPLFVKIWRIKTLVGQQRLQRNKITNVKATLLTLPMILGQAVILLIFTFVDPPQRTEVIETNINGQIQQSFVCETETNAFFITSLVCEAGFVLVGCILAYGSRHMNDDFGEAKQLIFAMYNVAFVGCMTVLITQIADMDVSGQYMVQAIGTFWGTTLSAAAFVVPRLVQVQQMHREGNISRYRTSRQTPSLLTTSNVRVSGVYTPNNMAGMSGVSGLSNSGGPMESIEEGEDEDDSNIDSSTDLNDAMEKLNDDIVVGDTEDTNMSQQSSAAHSVDWTGQPKPARSSYNNDIA